MNYAVILSGGIGTRMHMGDFPKQYYKVKDRMILEYTLDSFENAEAVDRIVIVMAPAWREKLEEDLPVGIIIQEIHASTNPGAASLSAVFFPAFTPVILFRGTAGSCN